MPWRLDADGIIVGSAAFIVNRESLTRLLRRLLDSTSQVPLDLCGLAILEWIARILDYFVGLISRIAINGGFEFGALGVVC